MAFLSNGSTITNRVNSLQMEVVYSRQCSVGAVSATYLPICSTLAVE